MLFDFSQSQFDMAASVDAMLTSGFSSEQLRAVWDDEGAAIDTIWKELAQIGLFSILVPEELDGGGAGLDDITLLLDRVGYHAVPGPIVETALVGVDVLTRFGSDAAKQQWLPRVSSGDAVIALAVGDRPVAGGQDADVVIAVSGGTASLIPAVSCQVRPLTSQDPTRRLAHVIWSEEAFEAGSLADGAADRAIAVAEFATAAVLVGINARLIEMTRDYLLERKQFGKVIGRFQALKHKLADTLTANEAARSLVWSASYHLSEDSADSRLTGTLAKSSASSASAITNAAALQLHGGIGFTWEHDLHLWLKRGKALEQAYGSHLVHRQAVGAAFLADQKAELA